jgi:glycine hydroxymethyltransferase
MYSLRRFNGDRFDRLNAIVDSLAGHISSYVDLVGSATLPLPEVCRIGCLPATACRVEGYRNARFFPATDPIDRAELLIEEATERLFGLDERYEVNAQPHTATQANHAVFRAILPEAGGTVAALAPSDGGHISHRFGIPRGTEFVALVAGDTGIDYDSAELIVSARRPDLLVAGGSSLTRPVDYARLREISDRVGCHLHADLAHTAPFVATGRHPPAFPFVDSATLDPSKNLRGGGGGILVYRHSTATAMRRAVFPVLQSAPNQHGLLAKAACLAYWTPDALAEYADRLIAVARILATRIEPALGAPVYGGTDSHLVLFDASRRVQDGRDAETELERARVLVNRNQVPNDSKPPWAPSGIRLSSTVPTILGYTDSDVQDLGDAICSILCHEGRHEAIIGRLLRTYHEPAVSISNAPTSEEPMRRLRPVAPRSV